MTTTERRERGSMTLLELLASRGWGPLDSHSGLSQFEMKKMLQRLIQMLKEQEVFLLNFGHLGTRELFRTLIEDVLTMEYCAGSPTTFDLLLWGSSLPSRERK